MRLTRRRIVNGVTVAVAVFVGFGLVTGLIQNPIWVRMVSRTPLDYAFLGATAVLGGRVVPVDLVHLAVADPSRLDDHLVCEQVIEVFVER